MWRERERDREERGERGGGKKVAVLILKVSGWDHIKFAVTKPDL